MEGFSIPKAFERTNFYFWGGDHVNGADSITRRVKLFVVEPYESIGAPLLGKMEGCSIPRAFERTNFLFFFGGGEFYEEFERYIS